MRSRAAGRALEFHEFVGSTLGPTSPVSLEDYKSKQVSEEIRLTSSSR
jgi:hypothetical protein